MPQKPSDSSVAAPVSGLGSADVRECRERAEAALREYAEASKFWNAPDDEHTRIQLRGLVNEIIEEVVPDGR